MAIEQHRRSRLWIDPGLQARYIVLNVLFLFFFTAIVCAGMYIGIWRTVTREFSTVRLNEDVQEIKRLREYTMVRTGQPLAAMPFIKEDVKALSQHQREVLNSILIRTNKRLIPLVAGLMGFIVFCSLVISHRLAGPIYRLKRSLASVVAGDLTSNFTLRQKDELKDLATELELTVAGFSNTLSSIKELINRLDKAKSEEERANYKKEIQNILAYYKIRSEK